MARSRNIQSPDDSGGMLEEIGRRQSRTTEDVARDILERTLTVARLTG